MPDLAVHLCAAVVLGKAVRDPHARVLFYAGNCLPDLADKTLKLGAFSPLPFAEVSHAPFGILCLSYAAAMLFEASLRKHAFWAFLVGGLFHALLDALKSNLGHGTILWTFPFSLERHEFGCYAPETSTAMLLPWFLGAALAAEAAERLVLRLRAPGPTA